VNPTATSADAGRNALKRAAAEAAVELVEDGMVVGLGTGSTAAFAVEALARRHRQGLRFVGIPTSERTAAQARAAGIPLSSFAEHRQIDLTIDGADEVERGTLNLIKGLGGALLREKIVANASRRLAIVVDGAKLVDRLGTHAPVPIEVVAFGLEVTRAALEVFAADVRPRLSPAGDLFVTDQEGATWLPNGNPFDELLHIQPGRHYGFPPRHPRHLPDVIDEPSLFDYAPQHQSTCGLTFNEHIKTSLSRSDGTRLTPDEARKEGAAGVSPAEQIHFVGQTSCLSLISIKYLSSSRSEALPAFLFCVLCVLLWLS